MTALLAIVTDAQNAQSDHESNKLCNDNNHEEDSKIHSSSYVHDNGVDINKDHICDTYNMKIRETISQQQNIGMSMMLQFFSAKALMETLEGAELPAQERKMNVQ